MKLFNHKLELTAIKSICDSPRKYKNKLLAVLQDEHFYSPPAIEARKRIGVLVRSSGDIPNYVELCTDPVISEDTRKILAKFEVDCVSSTKRMVSMIEHMHKYYQMRKLYFLSERINEALLKEKVDIDDLLEATSNDVTKARVKSDANQPIFHLGTGNNSTSLIKDLLNDDKVEFIPTGFKAFDERNGGFFSGSLVLVGGNSGAGKCLVGDSKVLLSDGCTERIDTLWENLIGIEVPYLNGTAKILNTPLDLRKHDGSIGSATKMFRTTGTTIKITLEDGKCLEGLAEHKVKVNTPNGMMFKRLDELQLDDDIVTCDLT